MLLSCVTRVAYVTRFGRWPLRVHGPVAAFAPGSLGSAAQEVHLVLDSVVVNAGSFARWHVASSLAPGGPCINRTHGAGFTQRHPALVRLQSVSYTRCKHVVLRFKPKHESRRRALPLVRAAMSIGLLPRKDIGLSVLFLLLRRGLNTRSRHFVFRDERALGYRRCDPAGIGRVDWRSVQKPHHPAIDERRFFGKVGGASFPLLRITCPVATCEPRLGTPTKPAVQQEG